MTVARGAAVLLVAALLVGAWWWSRTPEAPAPSAPSLLANGSFEAGLDGWEVVGAGAAVVKVGTGAAHGAHCLALAPPTAPEAKMSAWLRVPVTLEPGRRYLLRLRYQAGFDAPSARLAVALDEPLVYQELANLSTGQQGGTGEPVRGSWIAQEIRFFARQEQHALVLGPLTRFTPQIEWGTLWIDDVRLEALDQRLTRGIDHEHRLTLPSDVVVGEELELALTDVAFRRVDERENVGLDVAVPRPLPLVGKAALACSDPAAVFPHALAFAGETRHAVRVRFGTPGVQRFELSADGHVVRSNPVRVHAAAPEWRAFWGDLHIHTRYEHADWFGGEGEQNYAFARDIAGLDFAALSEHYTAESRPGWYERLAPATEAFDEPGRFVTLLGVETGSFYGHWNTYLRDGARERMFAPDQSRPLEARRRLHASGEPFLVLPHHMMVLQPTDWSLTDRRAFRLAELYSNHGSSEEVGGWWRHPRQAGRDYAKTPGARGHDYATALRTGLRLGVTASSDEHTARPGLSGLTCVLAERLERGSVFDALAARRTFATSGARLLLEFELADVAQGAEARVARGTPLSARLAMRGSAELTRVELLREDEVVAVRTPGTLDFEERVELPAFDGRPTWFRARVFQADGHRGWSSPIWLDPREQPDFLLEERGVALAGGTLALELENAGGAPGTAVLDVFGSQADARLVRLDPYGLQQDAWLLSLEPQTDTRVRLRLSLLVQDLVGGAFPFRARLEPTGVTDARVVSDPRGALRREGEAWVLEERLGGVPRAPESAQVETAVLEFDLTPAARLSLSMESGRALRTFLGSEELAGSTFEIDALHGLAGRTRLARREVELAPGALESVRLPRGDSGTYVLVLDADGLVAESDERNNSHAFKARAGR